MKKIALFISLFCSITMMAQDIIVKRDGGTISAKVINVTDKEVEYTDFDNQDGPAQRIYTAQIFSINYQNGEVKKFGDSGSDKTLADLPAAANNKELIAFHNAEITYNGTPSNKKTEWFFPVMGITNSSIISNDEVEMKFEKKYSKAHSGKVSYNNELRCVIAIYNKTDENIYIDLSKCFRIYDNGTYCTYGAPEQNFVIEDESNEHTIRTMLKKALLESTASSSDGVLKIMIIPPHSKTELPVAEDFHRFPTKSFEKTLKLNDVIKFQEDNSPMKRKYVITYSKTLDYTTYSKLTANLYVREVFGAKYVSFDTYGKLENIEKAGKEIYSSFSLSDGIIFNNLGYKGK